MTLSPHGRWLLCRPKYFDVTYEINPWMSVQRAPDTSLAQLQWKELDKTLGSLGASLDYIEPEAGHPDLVFTANAGLVRGNKVVLSHFKYPERQGEEPIFHRWFERNGYEVHTIKEYFEGEGDALFLGSTLFGGYGFRTDKEAFAPVKKILDIKEVVLCELTDSRFYHLDTCFCPIGPKKALYVPSAFSEASKILMSAHVELLPISEKDALKFACNAVVLGNSIVIPAGCEETKKTLASEGMKVHEVALNEFMKAGGSAKCLSLRIG